jgi:hypothetical protein
MDISSFFHRIPAFNEDRLLRTAIETGETYITGDLFFPCRQLIDDFHLSRRTDLFADPASGTCRISVVRNRVVRVCFSDEYRCQMFNGWLQERPLITMLPAFYDRIDNKADSLLYHSLQL